MCVEPVAGLVHRRPDRFEPGVVVARREANVLRRERGAERMRGRVETPGAVFESERSDDPIGELPLEGFRVRGLEERAVDLRRRVHELGEHGADDPEDLERIGGAINGAITTLRENEYIYRAWVRKYWGEAKVEQFAEVMSTLKSVDDAIHAFNDRGNEEEKTAELGKRLGKLRAYVDSWLSKTDV